MAGNDNGRDMSRRQFTATLGAVAGAAQKADPTLTGSSWGGAGGFLQWLARNVPEVASSPRPPGYVWDPKRFGEADLPGAVAEPDTDPSALQRQVTTVTDTSGLSRSNYRVLLTALAADLAAHPFDRAETSRRVRNACQEAGAAVGRSTIVRIANRPTPPVAHTATL